MQAQKFVNLVVAETEIQENPNLHRFIQPLQDVVVDEEFRAAYLKLGMVSQRLFRIRISRILHAAQTSKNTSDEMLSCIAKLEEIIRRF